MEDDDTFFEYRLDLIHSTRKSVIAFSVFWNMIPPFLVVADCDIAKFLLNLGPDVVEKSPVQRLVIFGGDKNGFEGGILFSEGELWQTHRKAMTKMLHLDILETYIETMDISAIAFAEKLCKSDKYLVRHINYKHKNYGIPAAAYQNGHFPKVLHFF